METRPMNMFTASKIKLHGMMTPKWTTKDKILQYKGLINLYSEYSYFCYGEYTLVMFQQETEK